MKKIFIFFDLKQLEKVAGVETDIAALEEALSFEEKSVKYYQKLSEKIKDPKVKRFFLKIPPLGILLKNIGDLRELDSWFIK